MVKEGGGLPRRRNILETERCRNMKKIWKTFLTAVLMSLAACLCMGTEVFAEVYEGSFEENPDVCWRVDTDAKTLTFSGKGALPPIDNLNSFLVNIEGLNTEDVQHIVIEDGITSASSLGFGLNGRTLALGKDVQQIPGRIYQVLSVSLSEENPYLNLYDGCLYTEDYTEMLYCPSGRDTLTLHPNVQKLCQSNLYQNQNITISSDGACFAMYEGCLYTRDYSELIHCPVYRPGLAFHPNLQIIGRYAFYRIADTKTVVVPWGVTTLRPYALNGISGVGLSVALPDTLTSVEMDYPLDGLVIYRDVQVLYSSRNEEMVGLRGMPSEEQQQLWAACYPGQSSQPESSAPEAPAAGELEQPTGDPTNPSPGPSDAKPAERPSAGDSSPSQPPQEPSRPASQPAEAVSKPPQAASKPASQPPAESSVPESSMPESSAPEASAPEVEENAAESESPSSPASSSEEAAEEISRVEATEAEEKTDAGFIWILPLIIALGSAAVVAAVILVRILRQ